MCCLRVNDHYGGPGQCLSCLSISNICTPYSLHVQSIYLCKKKLLTFIRFGRFGHLILCVLYCLHIVALDTNFWGFKIKCMSCIFLIIAGCCWIYTWTHLWFQFPSNRGSYRIFVALLGWIGFFWFVWLATKKSLGLAKRSLSVTGTTLSAYSYARHAHHHQS